MKKLLFLLFFSTVSYANPGVSVNTDIKKRSVTKHYQFTRCVNKACTFSSVTKFSKSFTSDRSFKASCLVVVKGNTRFLRCEKAKKTKGITKTRTVTKTVVKKVSKKNRIQVHVGKGPEGLNTEETNNFFSVQEDIGWIVGGQYTRMINEEFSIGASIFNNKSATVVLGIDY